MSRQNHRAFGLVNQVGRFGYLVRISFPRRVITRQIYLVGPNKFSAGSQQHVLGDIHQYWARTPSTSNVEGLIDCWSNVGDIHY